MLLILLPIRSPARCRPSPIFVFTQKITTLVTSSLQSQVFVLSIISLIVGSQLRVLIVVKNVVDSVSTWGSGMCAPDAPQMRPRCALGLSGALFSTL